MKLAIEADGPIHDDPELKQSAIERQKNLEAQGIQVISFTNEEISMHLETVIGKINDFIDEFHRHK